MECKFCDSFTSVCTNAECPMRGDCCPEAKGRQKEMKAVAKKASFDAKREQEERERPGSEFARLVWQRIGLARKRSGVSVETLVKARGESFYNASYDDSKQETMEAGEGTYKPESTVSFGYNNRACDMMKVRDVADALNCSVDYLLGRTEVPEVNTGIVPDSGTTWNTDNPEEEGDYLLILKDYYRVELKYEPWHWDGSEWKAEGYGSFYPDIDGDIIGWVPLPTPPKQETDSA